MLGGAGGLNSRLERRGTGSPRPHHNNRDEKDRRGHVDSSALGRARLHRGVSPPAPHPARFAPGAGLGAASRDRDLGLSGAQPRRRLQRVG